MDYAGGLADGIGPRLTGSPNMAKANAWTRDQLTKMGCANAHLEDWGEFGMGWQQLNTWVRMTEPDTAVFVAQATPWSPSTNGPVTAQAVSAVIDEESDIAKYKGKLSGKIVLLGAMRDVPVPDKPFFERYSDKDLKDLESLPLEAVGCQGAQRALCQTRQTQEGYSFRSWPRRRSPALSFPAGTVRMAEAPGLSSTITEPRWASLLITAILPSRSPWW